MDLFISFKETCPTSILNKKDLVCIAGALFLPLCGSQCEQGCSGRK
jgi:hypothetical protein